MSGDFWSRRKAAVEAEARTEERLEADQQAAQRDADLADKSDDEILTDLGLPDPDSLNEGDDFKVFLTDAIPARIRTRALRRLWLSNPVLANVDGLVDYGEDFTDAACVIENLKTAYQVGKGMTAHVEEMARQQELEAQGEAAEDAAPSDTDETAEQTAALDDDTVALAQVAPIPGNSFDEGEAPDPDLLHPTAVEADLDFPVEPAAIGRRMRFHFDPAT